MDRIRGHERALDILRSALRTGRMHHAWVFHGPAGIGKYTTAVELARVLLCHQPQDVRACGSCESCTLLARGDIRQSPHPDLHLIYKELAGVSDIATLRGRKQMNIPIDLLREQMVGGYVDNKNRYVEPTIGRKPMLRVAKVFILDEAELLDATGQNALLKTLEEPPPNTYIFLITAHEDRLLPTIRSRCQRVAMAPLSDAAVDQWIGERADAAKKQWLVRFARGSLGRADLAMEYGLDAWARTLTPMLEQIAAGRPDPSMGATMAELVDQFAESWVKNHKGASKDAANKAAVRHMLGLLGEICRAQLREVARGCDRSDPAASDQAAAPWLRGVELLQEAERNLESNVAIALLLDNLAIQWVVGEDLRVGN